MKIEKDKNVMKKKQTKGKSVKRKILNSSEENSDIANFVKNKKKS